MQPADAVGIRQVGGLERTRLQHDLGASYAFDHQRVESLPGHLVGEICNRQIGASLGKPRPTTDPASHRDRVVATADHFGEQRADY